MGWAETSRLSFSVTCGGNTRSATGPWVDGFQYVPRKLKEEWVGIGRSRGEPRPPGDDVISPVSHRSIIPLALCLRLDPPCHRRRSHIHAHASAHLPRSVLRGDPLIRMGDGERGGAVRLFFSLPRLPAYRLTLLAGADLSLVDRAVQGIVVVALPLRDIHAAGATVLAQMPVGVCAARDGRR